MRPIDSVPSEHAQSRPFKFIWTDVIKLTHAVGWILGRLLPKLSFPKHCHLPSLQMNQLQSSIILLGARWMHTSPLAGAGRLKGLIGAGDIKAGVLCATLEPLQSSERKLATSAYTAKRSAKQTNQITSGCRSGDDWHDLSRIGSFTGNILQRFMSPGSTRGTSDFWKQNVPVRLLPQYKTTLQKHNNLTKYFWFWL